MGIYGQGGVLCQGGVRQGRQGGQGGVGGRQGGQGGVGGRQGGQGGVGGRQEGRGLPSHCSRGTHSVSCTKQCKDDLAQRLFICHCTDTELPTVWT